jgi:hypothetical protein
VDGTLNRQRKEAHVEETAAKKGPAILLSTSPNPHKEPVAVRCTFQRVADELRRPGEAKARGIAVAIRHVIREREQHRTGCSKGMKAG